MRSLTIRSPVMGEKLRIAYDASAVPPRPAGAGMYTMQLAAALAERDDVELLVAAPAHAAPSLTWTTPPGALARNAWEQFVWPRDMQRHGADVCHGPHFAVPVRCQTPRVATVHDLTFYKLGRRYDLGHRWYYRALARTAARAERVIVPSAAVAGDVVRYLRYPVERIRVIPEAPRSGWTPATRQEIATAMARLQIEHPYLLMVGTAEPGKRAVDGIRALQLLHRRGIEATLVLAGNSGRLEARLRAEAARLGITEHVRFAGYIGDDTLRPLYSGAVVLLFLSLFEGFGLPPLEAMSCGTPVIATERPAMTEVLADAARFVPARDPAAVAAAVEALATDEEARNGLAARGLEHAATYSWARAAAETVAVYREVSKR